MAKINDHQTTGKAKVTVTQSATSRSATSRLPTASPSSAELDRASHVRDKIKHRLATNVNASATSVPPATSTTTTGTTAGASLKALPNERSTPDDGSSIRSLSASSTSVATLSSLLPEDVHNLPPASTSISTDPPPDDNDGFTFVTKRKKNRPRKMTEASGNATHPEQHANPAPRTTRPAVGVARPQPLLNAYPAFNVPVQEE